MKDMRGKTNRFAAGKIAGTVGLMINILLSVSKIFTGYLFGSVSVSADGWNNFSDAAASLITLLGFYFAGKPADKGHPYGHARYEYLSALSVSALILAIGFETLKSSFLKIFSPDQIRFSPVLIIVFLVSSLAKFVLMLYYKKVGKKFSSPVLIAAATDSRNDVVLTLSICATTLVEHYFSLRIDGYMGVLLAIFILYSGMKMGKEAISPLLGEGGDESLRKNLMDLICLEPIVIGCHDLLIHDYGPEKRYASVHVETDEKINSMQCHEILDDIERRCMKELGVSLLIHHDPVTLDDPETERLKKWISAALKMKDERIRIHDFRRKELNGKKEIFFDMALPQEIYSEKEKIVDSLKQALFDLDGEKYKFQIQIDLL